MALDVFERVAEVKEEVRKLVAELASINARVGSIADAFGVGASVPKATTKKVAPASAGKVSKLKGTKIAEKPCPICGTPNKARPYSYVCNKHPERKDKAFVQAALAKAKSAAPATTGANLGAVVLEVLNDKKTKTRAKKAK